MDSKSNINGSSKPVKWTPRQVILATIFVVGLILSILLLYRFRVVVLMLFVAIMIGTGLKPGVNFLAARGFSRTYAEIAIYAALLIAFWGTIFLALPSFLEQSTSLTSLSQRYYNDARRVMLNSQSAMLRNLGWKLSPNLDVEELATGIDPVPKTPEQQAAETAAVVTAALKYAGMIIRGVFFFVAVSLMTFYWTLESERAIRTLLMLFPADKRERIREVIDSVESRLGAFLFGQGILMLAVGALSLVAYLIIGLPNALLLALIAGLFEAVPMIGPAIGSIPAILVAASVDPSKILWIIVASIIIQQTENHLLVPRVMDRSVGVNPLLTILFIATLSSLMGIAGALLAVPIAAILQFLINRFVITPIREPDLKPEGRDYLSRLRLQVQEVASDSRKLNPIDDKDAITEEHDQDRIEEEIEALANDLDQILVQVQQPGEAHG